MSKGLLIEFFDHESLENVVSLTGGPYDQVVYLYFPQQNEPSPQERRALTGFIGARLGIGTEFIQVPEQTIPAVCAVFEELFRGGNRCEIDLTGGAELFSAAAGYFAARGTHQVVLQQYDPVSGARIFRHPETSDLGSRLALSVPEAVSLHRASLLGCPPRMDRETFRHGLGEEILRLWETVKDIPQSWNRFCALPGLTASAQRQGKQEKGLLSPGDADAYEAVMSRLRARKLVGPEKTRRSGGREYRVFSLNVSDGAEVLYQKGGNLLEYYCGWAAVESGLFHDCRVGVELDWDGRKDHPSANVKNEVDVVLTQGHRPIFMSCKNTRVVNEHLYEVMTMARHYGGRYARAAAVSTSSHSAATRARAEDMGIVLIDRLPKLSPEGFVELLEKRFAR